MINSVPRPDILSPHLGALEHSRLLQSPEISAMPISAHEAEIRAAYHDHSIVITEGGTGSGKTTGSPLILLDQYEKIVNSQPRIAAAKGVSERIAYLLRSSGHDELASQVGYRVAEHGNTTPDTRLAIATDGLLVQWMLFANILQREGTVVVVDEAHEANKNISLAMAAIRYAQEEGTLRAKVGIMSATMDTAGMSAYYSGAPIVKIAGRMFPVTERVGGMVVDEAERFVKEGLNPIVFVPGIPETEATAAAIRARVPKGVKVLVAHGQQTIAEQSLLFRHYPGGKVIVGTNVLQTSLTIDDMDVVIDSQWSRIGHALQDVQTLDMVPSSLASSEQRKGRVGRTKPGVYVRAQLEGYPEVISDTERTAYDAAEIQTSRLDDLVLKLRQAGLNPRQLTYFHEPREKQFVAAEARLRRIGALDPQHQVTEVGQEMGYLSLDPMWARMVVEARRYSGAVGLQAAALAAVRQSGGIVRSEEGVVSRWRRFTKETRSEPIAELDVFIEALGMSSDQEVEGYGIVMRRLQSAIIKFENICESEGLNWHQIRKPSDPERKQLIACMVVSAEEFFKRTRSGSYVDTRSGRRELRDDSVVHHAAKLLLGQAFNLTVVTRGNFKLKKFMNGATDVGDLKALQELIPERLRYKQIGFTFDAHTGAPIAKTQLHLDDTIWFPRYGREPAKPSTELDIFLLHSLMAKERVPKGVYPMRRQVRPIIRALYDLQDRTEEDLVVDATIEQLAVNIAATLPEHITSLAEADKYLPKLSLQHLVDQGVIEVVEYLSPKEIRVQNKTLPVTYKDGVATVCLPIPEWSGLPEFLPGLEGRKVYIKESPKAASVPFEKAQQLVQPGLTRDARRGNDAGPVDMGEYRVARIPRNKMRTIRSAIQPKRHYGN